MVIAERGSSSCRVLGIGVFVAAGLFATAAKAETQQQVDWCNNNGGAVALDLRISGCTAVIQSRTNPRDLVLAYVARGTARSEMGDHDGAIADYDEAIRLDPKYAVGYRERAAAWRRKGDLDRAIADYSEVVRLDPKDARAFNNRGFAYFERKDYARAIGDYNEAIRLSPNYAAAFNYRGLAYFHRKDYDRAIAEYDQAIRLHPNSTYFLSNRVNAYKAKGDLDRANADREAIRRLNTIDAFALNNRANASIAEGQLDRANAGLNAEKLGPPTAQADLRAALMEKATAASAAKNWNEAEAALAVKAVKDNDPAALSFSDYEFILSYQDASPANKEAAQKVWETIQKRVNGVAKLPVKIIAVGTDGIDAAITDENRATNKPDLHIARAKQMTRPPAPGDEANVVGAITSYRSRPFLFIMDQGALTEIAPPARNSR